ncbi:hypothetical protein [Paenibacillus alvei]|uniref:hypothetical protein n=1 Tax=Paenibacillus alvei TaxID=44250 RepID=UPI0013D98391|nr:hypothetical protein [Paenibacillus alvei]NEZ45588.1 hypothetical protein [Paenibacillus alvei]
MTYTREQLEQMTDGELEEIVPKVAGWREEEHPGVNGTGQWMAEYEYGVYYKQDGNMIEVLGYEPATEVEESLELQELAIERNAVEYVRQLDGLMWPSGYAIAHDYALRNVIKMLQATPRQRTIASILTLQGHGGTGDE